MNNISVLSIDENVYRKFIVIDLHAKMEKLALLSSFIKFEDLKRKRKRLYRFFSLCNYLHVHRKWKQNNHLPVHR